MTQLKGLFSLMCFAALFHWVGSCLNLYIVTSGKAQRECSSTSNPSALVPSLLMRGPNPCDRRRHCFTVHCKQTMGVQQHNESIFTCIVVNFGCLMTDFTLNQCISVVNSAQAYSFLPPSVIFLSSSSWEPISILLMYHLLGLCAKALKRRQIMKSGLMNPFHFHTQLLFQLAASN